MALFHSHSIRSRKAQRLYPLALLLIVGMVWGAAIINNNYVVGPNLRVYRIAVAATTEFTDHHGGTEAGALTAIKDIIAEVNKVYEQELAIRLQLVSDPLQNSIIFTAAEGDSYSPGNRSSQIAQNQIELDANIGTANYDIGHVFGIVSSGGGLAGLGVVGSASSKARGVSETSNPSASSAGFIGVVLHEIGHQFGAQHTFNADAIGSCATNRSSSNAYEPASGSTIMSYAGICDADNLQPNEDLYFHAASFEQINEYIENNAHAAPIQTTATSNNAPTVSEGADYVIPANTPFELTATASDADGDTLTYTWEQLDLGVSMSLPLFDNGDSPLFRSFLPSSNPTRTFPALSDLLAGTLNIGEALPTTNRDLNFRVTVRDNNAAGGGLNSNDVFVQVKSTGTAFALTAPNGGQTITGGDSQTITWNVANTDSDVDINASQVDILLSTDGGQTFPFLLATTANNGSASVPMPNITTTTARIKIRGTGNIFFDLSNNNFTINNNPAAVGVSLTETGAATMATENGLVDTYSLNLNTAPSGTVTITATADDQSELSTDGNTYANSTSVSLNSISPATVYVRAVDDGDTEGGHTSIITHAITTSTSASYPTSTLVNQLVVQIEDNESPPFIGVDIDFTDSSPSPTNWATLKIDSASESLTELTRDDGVATEVDFRTQISGGTPGSSTKSPASTSIPSHTPELSDVGGYARSGSSQSLVATWSGLIPDRNYGVIVLGQENSSGSYGQTVTIAGATTLPSFSQTLSDSQLRVNQVIGSSAQNLEDNELVVAADGSGEITVSVAPTGSGFSLAGMALHEILPSTPGITSTLASLSEGGASDSYEINLNTDPGGSVTLAIDADADSEISLDGSTFDSSVTFTTFTTQSISIFTRAIDDTLVEGSHSTTLTNTITASTSTTYPVILGLENSIISITDNDSFSPLAGIDFDSGSNSPTNWTSVSSSTSKSNLTLDDGSASSVNWNGASRNASGGTSPSASTIPIHTPNLASIDFVNLYTSASPSFTWFGLTPNQAYNVYVFALENFGFDIDQDVTITGADTPITFTQATTIGTELWVNGQKGSNLSALESFAITMTANGSGEIGVSIAKGGVTYVCLAGMAIQEAPANPGITVDSGDGIALAEGGSVDTYTIGLDSVPSGSVEITVTADAQSEVSLDGSNFATTRVFTRTDTSSQAITTRAIDDATDEPAHTTRITHTITNTADAGQYPLTSFIAPITGTIVDNDSEVSIVANDATGAEPSDNAQFTVALTAGDVAPSGGVTVNYTITGSATNSSDYTTLTGSITIAAGTNANVIDVTVTNDGDSELPESIVLTLTTTDVGSISVAGSPINSATAIITSDEQTAYHSWLSSYFSNADLSNTSKEASLWGLNADPDNDQLVTLQEYFHNRSPLISNEPPVSSSVVTDMGTQYLEMVFPRRTSLSGVTQTIQEGATPAEASFGTAASASESTTSIDANTEEVTIRLTVGSLVRGFLRLQLTSN